VGSDSQELSAAKNAKRGRSPSLKSKIITSHGPHQLLALACKRQASSAQVSTRLIAKYRLGRYSTSYVEGSKSNTDWSDNEIPLRDHKDYK
jgi:hypothetical protein